MSENPDTWFDDLHENDGALIKNKFSSERRSDKSEGIQNIN